MLLHKPEEVLGMESRFRSSLMLVYYLAYIAFSLLYFTFVVPRLPLFLRNPRLHNFFVLAVLPSPWVLIVILQITDPGEITTHNVDDYLKIYPYDSSLYRPAKCSHLSIPAVPRSCFCPFTRQRIAKFDHYCPWAVQAIGQGTIGLYFVLLIANLSIFAYSAVVCYQLLGWKTREIIQNRSFRGSEVVWNVLDEESTVCGLALFCTITAGSLLVAATRQFYLISVNMTSVEIEKYRKEKKANVHYYSKGFVRNWLEVISPPAVGSPP
jgi:hypothetical protein